MLPLDPEFSGLLLSYAEMQPVPVRVLRPKLKKRPTSFVRSSSNKVKKEYDSVQRPLTPEVLEEYEELIGRRLILQRVLYREFQAQTQPPAPEATTHRKRRHSRKKAQPPEGLQEVLADLEHQIDRIHKDYMPYFHDVHAYWQGHRRSRELGDARRAFQMPGLRRLLRKENIIKLLRILSVLIKRLSPRRRHKNPQQPAVGPAADSKPSSKKKAADSKYGFMFILCCVAVITFLSMPFLAAQKDTPWSTFGDEQQLLLRAWEKGAHAGDDDYLEGLVGAQIVPVRQLGDTLVARGSYWAGHGNPEQARMYLTLACRIGAVMERVSLDGRLLAQANKSLGLLEATPSHEVTVKD